jgi:hypothetical protein
MKHTKTPKTLKSPLLNLTKENRTSNNEYKIHKELIKKEFIKKVINGEISTQQIREVLNKKTKGEKN